MMGSRPPTDFGTGGPGSSTSPGENTGNGSSRSTDVAAIAGGVVGGVLGLLVLVGGALWCVRRRRTRGPLLLDVARAPSPFPVPPLSRGAPQVSTSHFPEIQQREVEQTRPLLALTTPPSSAATFGGSTSTSDPVSNHPVPGASTRGPAPHAPQQDELIGLRTEIEDLRRIMLNVRVEEQGIQEAPPEYS